MLRYRLRNNIKYSKTKISPNIPVIAAVKVLNTCFKILSWKMPDYTDKCSIDYRAFFILHEIGAGGPGVSLRTLILYC